MLFDVTATLFNEILAKIEELPQACMLITVSQIILLNYSLLKWEIAAKYRME